MGTVALLISMACPILATGVPEPIETRFFNGAPFFRDPPILKETSIQVGDQNIRGFDVQELLEREGIQFPQGSRAVILKDSQVLIVQNTLESLDLINFLLHASTYDPPNALRHELTLVKLPPSPGGLTKSPPSFEELRKAAGAQWEVIWTFETIADSGNLSKFSVSPVPDESIKGTIGTALAPDGVLFDTKIEFSYESTNSNRKPRRFSYSCDAAGKIDAPLVVQMFETREASTAYALVLRVSFVNSPADLEESGRRLDRIESEFRPPQGVFGGHAKE